MHWIVYKVVDLISLKAQRSDYQLNRQNRGGIANSFTFLKDKYAHMYVHANK